ncbi:MAG: phosphomannomutase/phosphoglucomutase, partial [Gammaproteobacteria bacterium]
INEPGLIDHMKPAMIVVFWLILISILIFLKQRQLSGSIRNDQKLVVSIIENKLKGVKQNLMSNFALLDNKEMFSKLSQTEISADAVSKVKKTRKTKPSIKEPPEPNNKPAFPSSASQFEGAAAEVQDIDLAEVSPEMFRAYDIRGVVGENLNIEQAYVIGKAIGTFAIEKGQSTMLVARDGRASSKDLASMLSRGLAETGIDIIDIGLMPTPVMYFATHFLSVGSGVMITGSHNPAEYNGFKVVIDGEALSGDQIQAIYQRIVSGDFASGEGGLETEDVTADYIDRITEDIQLLKPMKVVIDCGHGVASVVARNLFESIGCDVKTLYCEVDSQFPAHHPDPGNPENLKDLSKMVVEENADLGIAFDGDGDRLGVVDSGGNIILPDRVLMVLAEDVLIRNPGADIIYDVKSTKLLASYILSQGGRPIMWKSGHSLMKLKLKETGALLAGELSGHIFFTERWYGFDDALYAAARLLEVVSGDGRSSAAMFSAFPDSINTPEISISVKEGMQHKIMAKVHESKEKLFPGAKINDIDGIRAEYPGAWGLIRASNTTPSLVLRFEADDEESLEKVKKIFRALIKAVLPKSEPGF